MDIFKVKKLSPNESHTTLWTTPTVLHFHSDWEFTTLISGTGTNIVNGISYDTTPFTFVLLGPQHQHQQVSNVALQRRDICVSIEKMKELCDVLQSGLYDKLTNIQTPINITLDPFIFNIINDRLNNLSVVISKKKQQMVLLSIAVYLLGVYVENLESNKLPHNLTEFILKINNPEIFCMRINSIIDLSNYSHSHFAKIFKKYMGRTLIDYITDLRLSYAAKLLSSTTLSILEISSQVGYDNSSFFSQKFLKKYKVSPKEYRKNNS